MPCAKPIRRTERSCGFFVCVSKNGFGKGRERTYGEEDGGFFHHARDADLHGADVFEPVEYGDKFCVIRVSYIPTRTARHVLILQKCIHISAPPKKQGKEHMPNQRRDTAQNLETEQFPLGRGIIVRGLEAHDAVDEGEGEERVGEEGDEGPECEGAPG
jgi:hypothetical protein